MERYSLIKTAETLQQVSGKSAAEYSDKRDMMVGLANKKMEERADLLELIGPGNIEMMKDNHANHARFMESIFYQHSPEILTNTVIWVFRAYRSRNFRTIYWSAQLNTWIEIFKKELSPECYQEVYPYYCWMQINIPAFEKIANDKPEVPYPSHE